MATDNKTSVVITAIDATKEGFASAEAGLQSLAGRFISLTNPITAASLAIGSAAGAIGLSVRSAIDTGDSFNKLSQKTGIAVESLSALAYAGTLSDVSIEALATGIKKLSVNMNEAAVSTSGKAAEAFKALGVSVKDSSGALRGSETVLADIADQFAGMKDGAGKTALAVALFGKAGADLIPFLNQGSKGIAELTAEAEKLGLIMTGKTAKAAEEFNDNIKKLSLSTAALGRSITADLIGPLAEYTRLMVEARKEGLGVFGSIAVGLRTGGAESAPLQDLRDRAASLQGTISFLTQGGQRPNDPVFGAKLKDSEAELAILQKIIAARMKAVEDFGPPALPTEKKDAPTFGGKDGADKESAYLASLRTQLLAAQGDVSQYSRVLEAVTSGSAKDFSRATKDSALALATKIDRLKEATKANEDHAKVLEKVATAESAASKTVGDFSFKQDQNVAGINSRTDALGKTPFEIKQAEAARAIEKEYEDAVKKVNEELGKIGDIEGISAKTYELAQARDKAHAATAAALDAEKVKQDELNASWEYGANTALRKYGEEVANLAATVEGALTRAFKSAEDALVQFVMTGKLDFKSLATSIISDLVRIQIQQSITKPLASAGGDFLSRIFSPGFGDTAGLAAGVPRYAQGTPYVPNDGLAFLHKGEAVIPAASNRGGTGGGMVVNIIEDSSRAGQTQSRQEQGGASVLDVFVDRIRAAVAGDITRGAGPIPAALAGTYGLNRAAGGY